MLILHCTNKFLDHLGLSVSNTKPGKEKSILSDWSATYFWHNDQLVYLFVNNDTLFSFTVRDMQPATFKLDLYAGLIDSLQRAQVPFDLVDTMGKEMRDIILKKNTNRHILGSINNLVFMYQHMMKLSENQDMINMNDIERKMITVPFKYNNYRYPIELLKEKLNIA